MTFHVYNGDNWTKHTTLAEAQKEATVAIVDAQCCCDPEWPDWVNHIAVYEAPDDCECPDEDGMLLFQSSECNVREADDGCGCDYFCDYQLEKVTIWKAGA